MKIALNEPSNVLGFDSSIKLEGCFMRDKGGFIVASSRVKGGSLRKGFFAAKSIGWVNPDDFGKQVRDYPLLVFPNRALAEQFVASHIELHEAMIGRDATRTSYWDLEIRPLSKNIAALFCDQHLVSADSLLQSCFER